MNRGRRCSRLARIAAGHHHMLTHCGGLYAWKERERTRWPGGGKSFSTGSAPCSTPKRPIVAPPSPWERLIPCQIGASKHPMIIAAAILIASVPCGEAKGCIKGASVGGIAGQMAGHGKAGAAPGCAIGHHEANKAADKANTQAPPTQK